MIFSIFLTVALGAVLFYALLQNKQFPVVSHTLPIICLGGIFAAWFPDKTTDLANLVGIGRGADLMLYVWVVVSLLLILVLHLKLVAHGRRFTELARWIAIERARPPEDALKSRDVR